MNQNPVAPSPAALDKCWTVNETIAAFPESIAVFNYVGIDTCCGGDSTLEMAASEASMNADALLEALRISIQASGDGP